jgi:putative acetyltransferase
VLLQINKDHARPSEPNGFEHAGEDVNPTSGRPVLKIARQA